MSYETNDKMVSHPDHYKSGKYEVIDIIDEFCKDLSGTECICTANAIKYILRWKKKNGTQDLNKAIWYLQHLVDYRDGIVTEDKTCKRCRFYEEGCAISYKHVNNTSSPSCKDFEVKRGLEAPCMQADVENKNKTTYSKEFVDKAIENVPKPVERHCGTCKHEDELPTGKTCQGCSVVTFDHSNWEPKEETDIHLKLSKAGEKLEPGCDKCEISECGFLKDPFMNPPYDTLMKQFINMQDYAQDMENNYADAEAEIEELETMNQNQKETINDLLRESKEKQDSIDILEDDKKKLKEKNDELMATNNGLWDILYKISRENDELKEKLSMTQSALKRETES